MGNSIKIWRTKFCAMASVFLLLGAPTCTLASTNIEQESGLPVDEPVSNQIPSEILDAEEFNDFNYMGAQYQQTKPGSDLIDVEFEPIIESKQHSSNGAPTAASQSSNDKNHTAGSPRQADTKVSTQQSAEKRSINALASVVSVEPENDTTNPTDITIIFSQDMIAPQILSESPADSAPPSIKISPAVIGVWHWFTPRVLVFKPNAKKFPRSTVFTVQVPKLFIERQRTKLAEVKTWKFTTPRIAYSQVIGGFNQRGLCVPLQFNQPAKIRSLLTKTHMIVDGKTIPLRQATQQEGKKLLGDFINTPGAYCLVPTVTLPSNKSGKVIIDQGIEAEEGTLSTLTGSEQDILTASDHLICQSPSTLSANNHEPWIVRFDGPIDLEQNQVLKLSELQQSMFRITPPLPKQKITANTDAIFIRGRAQPGRKYLLTISSNLPGVAGTLAKEIQIELVSSNPDAGEVLPLPSQAYVVTPFDPAKISIFSKNTPQIDATVYDAEALYSEKIPPMDNREDLQTKPFLFQRRITCAPFSGGIDVSELDLSSLRQLKHKQFILCVKTPEQPLSQGPIAWIQFVSSNVTSLTSNSSAEIICTNLSNGKPEDAISATALPDSHFQKTGKGQFNLNKSLHDQQQSAVKVVTKNGVMLLPNEMKYSHWENEERRPPKISLFLTGDFERATVMEPVKFAGFLTVLNERGEKHHAADGEIKFVAEDSDGKTIGSGSTAVKHGFFSGNLPLPETAKTGGGIVRYAYRNTTMETAFEFKAAFNISPGMVKSESSFQCVPAASAAGLAPEGQLTLFSKYGGLDALYPDAKTNWSVIASRTTFVPQGWNDFQFGYNRLLTEGNQVVNSNVSADGFGTIKIKYRNVSSTPILLKAYTNTTFATIEQSTKAQSFLIQPAEILVGVKTRIQSGAGKKIVEVESVVTDVNGNVLPGRKAQIRVLKDKDAVHVWDNPEVASVNFTSAAKPNTLQLTVKDEPGLVLIASIEDEHNQPSRTILDISPVGRRIEASLAAPLVVSLDKPVYHPGDKCTLKLQQPFQSSNGFAALATERSIETISVQGKSEKKEFPLIVPQAANGELSGIVKLFETNSGEKICPEAEGAFQIHVEPNLKPIRIRLEYNTAQVTVRVSDEDDQPVPDANVILRSYIDNENAALNDENFRTQMLNPETTYLFASSLTRAPKLSLIGNERKSITHLPGQLFQESIGDRIFRPMLENTTDKPIFPLQTLRTDKDGIASVSMPSVPPPGNTRISAFAMTDKGDGFASAFTMFPHTKSDSHDNALVEQQRFNNFDLYQSNICELHDQNCIFKSEQASAVPIGIVVSNSMLTPVAVAAERMMLQNPQTSDLRIARLITLISLLPYVQDRSTQQRYRSAIADDIKIIASLSNMEQLSDVSWIPKRMPYGQLTFKFEPVNLLPFFLHSLVLAKQRGFYEWTTISTLHDETLNRVVTGIEQGIPQSEVSKAIAYSGYVGSKINKYQRYSRTSSLTRAAALCWQDVHAVDTLPPETLAWLVATGNSLSLPKPVKEALDKRFLDCVRSELAQTNNETRKGSEIQLIRNVDSLKEAEADRAPAVHDPDEVRRLSAFLLGQMVLDPTNQVAQKIASKIETTLKDKVYVYNDVQTSFAAVALSEYYSQDRCRAAASATIKLANGASMRFAFPANSVRIESRQIFGPIRIVEHAGSPGVTGGMVLADLNTHATASSCGIIVKRTLKPGKEKSTDYYVDSRGIWHCKVGSTFTEYIEFAPERAIEHVVLQAPAAVNGIIRLSDLPKSAPNAAQYKEGDYAVSWPQTIAAEKNNLKVYGSDFKPGIYKFAYHITFLSPGSVKLPAATIEEPYKHSCYGRSQEQIVIVDPN